MQDKAFFKDMALQGAEDFKSGRLGRHDFLVLCAVTGAAPFAVAAGDAEAAANEIVL